MPVRKTLKELIRITSHQHADMRIIDLTMLDEFGSNKYKKRQENRKSQPRRGNAQHGGYQMPGKEDGTGSGRRRRKVETYENSDIGSMLDDMNVSRNCPMRTMAGQEPKWARTGARKAV